MDGRAPIALSVLLGVACAEADGIVWNWLANPTAGCQGCYFGEPIGQPVYTRPEVPVRSIPLDLNGDGTMDFEFRAVGIQPTLIEVLQHGSNEVLAITVPPPDIGEVAVSLATTNLVSSATPEGADWLPAMPGPLGDIGAMLNWRFTAEHQYSLQRRYIGVRFSASDGVHYGALQVIAWNDGDPLVDNTGGMIFGYGYNLVPNAPFTLSTIPPVPVRVDESSQVRSGYLRLRWSTDAGAALGTAYQVQSRSDLINGSWTDLPFVVIATGTNTLVDVPMGGGAGFFRVVKAD